MSKAQFASASDLALDFAYGAPANDAAGLRLSLSIFADRPVLREQMREDALGAGFRVAEAGDIASLLEGEARPLGDVVLVDCPAVDGATLAALSRLDVRAANAALELVVSTSVDALDDVFGALDQCGPQILVTPSRAERMIALGRVLARMPGRRVRELSEEDRLVLLRLTEQVSQIAERIDRISPSAGTTIGGGTATNAAPASADPGAFRFDTARSGAGQGDDATDRLVRTARPCPIRASSAASSANGKCALVSSMAICLPIRRGICCSISPLPAPNTPGCPSPACASPQACHPPPRCAGSAR